MLFVCVCGEGTVLSDVAATVIDPSGVEDRCDIAEESPGVYQVLFRPRETGLHLVAVDKNHSPVPGTSRYWEGRRVTKVLWGQRTHEKLAVVDFPKMLHILWRFVPALSFSSTDLGPDLQTFLRCS